VVSNDEAADLTAGRWYANIGTEAYMARFGYGEIRGQIVLGE
jgi:hypothetical protein